MRACMPRSGNWTTGSVQAAGPEGETNLPSKSDPRSGHVKPAVISPAGQSYVTFPGRFWNIVVGGNSNRALDLRTHRPLDEFYISVAWMTERKNPSDGQGHYGNIQIRKLNFFFFKCTFETELSIVAQLYYIRCQQSARGHKNNSHSYVWHLYIEPLADDIGDVRVVASNVTERLRR